MRNHVSATYHNPDTDYQLNFCISDARRFCELIDPNAERFDFRAIGPEYLDRGEQRSFKHRGKLEGRILNYLKQNNHDGYGIYMTINETDGKGVMAANIVRVRAIYADLDDGLPDEWPLEPSFLVNSSPGKYQAYWLLKDEMTPDQFASVMRGVGQRWGSANEAKDICRVLRVPGFWHQKKRDKPYRVRFASNVEDDPVRYKASKLVKVFGVAEPKPSLPKSITNDNSNWTDEEIESMLETLPASFWDERENWLRIGMALHDHYGGSETGFALWHSYAKQSAKNNPNDDRKTWDHFGKSSGVTLGSLVKIAKGYGWERETKPLVHIPGSRNWQKKRKRQQKSQPGQKEATGDLIIRQLSEYEEQHIDWLWKYRIPRNMISLLAGFGDVGKSTLLYDIAARVSTGKRWPNNEGVAKKGSVILFNREDTAEHIIKPRVMAAKGDVSKIYVVDGLRDSEGNKRPFNIKEDIAELDRHIQRIGDVQLVIFDPLSSYFDTGTNTWQESQVRAILEPLAEKVNEWDCALIGNTHLGKTAHQGNANLRILNSVGIVNLARMVNMVVKDPEDDEIRIFGQTKRNIAKAKSSLRFRFETEFVGPKKVEATRLKWVGETDLDAGDMISDDATSNKITKRDLVKQWLQGFLSGGPKTWDAITSEGQALGHSERTLRRAREDLKLVKQKEPGSLVGSWVWSLPTKA